MPTYPVKNLKTGETKELNMSMKKYDEWRKENPDWDKDWSQGTGGTVSSTGDVYSCLLYTSPSPRDRTRSRMPSSA